VSDLFDPDHMHILCQYLAAQAAGAEIRKAGKNAAAVEQFIRDRYRRSEDRPDRRKYMSLPCYPQDLLHSVSTTFTAHPDNYDLLVAALTGCVTWCL
jgi:hypothetical protein